MRGPYAAALVVATCFACRGEAEDHSKPKAELQPPAPPPVAAEPPVAKTTAPTTNDDLLKDADRIAAKVSEMRGLSLNEPIKRGVMNKDQITERLLQRVKDEYAPEELAREEVALKRLGLIPLDKKYLDMVIELLKQQIAGFYDPWEKELYIMEGAGALGGEEVMAHEIDHALQDQHFGLKKWLAEVKKNADATLARQALVEGDGTVLMIEYKDQKAGSGPTSWAEPEFVQDQAAAIRMGLVLMSDVPLYLRESLVFPYVNGLKFVGSARASKSWGEVDGFYKKPPLSTEHIIHPDKYDTYERPVEIRAAKLKGRALGYDNVLGEMGLWLLLRQHGLSEDMAKEAVGGWGGDRIAVFTPPDKTSDPASATAVIYTVWDRSADADEFFAGAMGVLAGLSGGSVLVKNDNHVDFKGPSGVASIEKKKDAVLLVVGPEVNAALRAQIWKGWKVKRPKK